MTLLKPTMETEVGLSAVLIAGLMPEEVGVTSRGTDRTTSFGTTDIETTGANPEDIINKQSNAQRLNDSFRVIAGKEWILVESAEAWPSIDESIGTILEATTRFFQSISCRFSLSKAAHSNGITISDEVKRFVCEELMLELPQLPVQLNDLTQLARRFFPECVYLSLEMFKNPELPEEKNIQININVRKAQEKSFTCYHHFIRSFVKDFPFEFRQWFQISVTYV